MCNCIDVTNQTNLCRPNDEDFVCYEHEYYLDSGGRSHCCAVYYGNWEDYLYCLNQNKKDYERITYINSKKLYYKD